MGQEAGFRMADLVITIDGPAGSGKSTVARLVAEKLGANFLDTGAMYRAVTLAAMEAGVDMSDENQLVTVFDTHRFRFAAVGDVMAVYIDGKDVTERIRKPEATANVRYIASSPKMRARLVEMQRQFAAGQERIVTEGRDQGTVAFPDAHIKFFLTADVGERARRRQAELQAQGITESIENTKAAIEARDRSDENRTVGPLKPACDAVVIDTTTLSVEGVVDEVIRFVENRCRAKR